MENIAPYRPRPAITALGPNFYDVVTAADFPTHILRFRNDRHAAHIGLAHLTDAEWLAHFGQFQPLADNLATPLALRYHGHQFRQYNPDIGDGRGFLFAQMEDSTGRLLDLGTKGSGQTPYSRFGDGRLTLKGGVREILATEMLEALGVYTSKSFSLIETGEALTRNDEPSPTRACVLVRLSHSHIRYGTFQRLAALDAAQDMEKLIDYCLAHLIPPSDTPDRYAALFDHAVASAARLVAQWTAAGFVHGVLNTDNINITGESFDYGPWRFTPRWDGGFTAAYFDQTGLYAFGRQAEALQWNLQQLGIALRLVAPLESLMPAFQNYPALYEAELCAALFWRLGIKARSETEDLALVEALMTALASDAVSVDHFFFDWRGGTLRDPQGPRASHYDQAPVAAFAKAIRDYEPASGALDHAYWQREAPCTMWIEDVENLWAAIDGQENWQALADKIADIRTMGAAYSPR